MRNLCTGTEDRAIAKPVISLTRWTWTSSPKVLKPQPNTPSCKRWAAIIARATCLADPLQQAMCLAGTGRVCLARGRLKYHLHQIKRLSLRFERIARIGG